MSDSHQPGVTAQEVCFEMIAGNSKYEELHSNRSQTSRTCHRGFQKAEDDTLTSRQWRLFASVGTHPQAFNRLLKELDLVAAKHTEWEIFVQTGNSNYGPKKFAFKKFLKGKKFGEKMQWADVILSHGGAGTIINALLNKKPLIVVPRLERFREHTNDHQLDLAKALERKGKALAVFDIKDLEKKILQSFSFNPNLLSEKENLIKRISLFLEEGK